MGLLNISPPEDNVISQRGEALSLRKRRTLFRGLWVGRYDQFPKKIPTQPKVLKNNDRAKGATEKKNTERVLFTCNIQVLFC